MKPNNPNWIPTPEFVIQVFRLMAEIPECSDLQDATCMNFEGILGVIDKITYGWPGNENPSIIARAAVLMHDLIVYHYFTDGNKRIGFTMLLIFLQKNGLELEASEDENVEFALAIAQDLLSNEEIERWIENYLNRGE
jgi:death-on-curing family protein